jgi:hypothetical protein
MRDLIAEIPFLVALSTYLSWTLLFFFGHVRDLLAKLFWGGTHPTSKAEHGYAQLRQDYEDFYTRRAYYRVVECFERPLVSSPGRVMDVIIRSGKPGMMEHQKPTGEIRKVINLGSYNYLGFASQVRRSSRRCCCCCGCRWLINTVLMFNRYLMWVTFHAAASLCSGYGQTLYDFGEALCSRTFTSDMLAT